MRVGTTTDKSVSNLSIYLVLYYLFVPKTPYQKFRSSNIVSQCLTSFKNFFFFFSRMLCWLWKHKQNLTCQKRRGGKAAGLIFLVKIKWETNRWLTWRVKASKGIGSNVVTKYTSSNSLLINCPQFVMLYINPRPNH